MVLVTVSVSMAYNDMVLTEGDHACAKKNMSEGDPPRRWGGRGQYRDV